MNRINFTKRALDALKVPQSGKRFSYFDTKVPGLVVYVTASRVKSYYMYKKVSGKPVRVFIGHYPDFTPEQARARAVEIVGKIANGDDLTKQLSKADTLNDLWTEYSASKSHLKRLTDQRSWYNRYLRAPLGNKPLNAISGRDIDRVTTSILNEGKRSTAVHVLELFKRLIKFGADRNLCAPLSFKVIIPRYDDRKTEDLSSEQLIRLLTVLAEEKDRQVADLMSLILCTGIRKSEALRLQRQDIDLDKNFITIRDPKGGTNETIPMNETAIKILSSIPRTDSPYIFPNKSGGHRHRNAFAKQLRRIRKEAGIPDSFRPLHGLRHVYASMLASSGKVDMYVLQKLLTHKSPRMTQRYAHLRDESLRKAAAVIDDLIPVK